MADSRAVPHHRDITNGRRHQAVVPWNIHTYIHTCRHSGWFRINSGRPYWVVVTTRIIVSMVIGGMQCHTIIRRSRLSKHDTTDTDNRRYCPHTCWHTNSFRSAVYADWVKKRHLFFARCLLPVSGYRMTWLSLGRNTAVLENRCRGQCHQIDTPTNVVIWIRSYLVSADVDQPMQHSFGRVWGKHKRRRLYNIHIGLCSAGMTLRLVDISHVTSPPWFTVTWLGHGMTLPLFMIRS